MALSTVPFRPDDALIDRHATASPDWALLNNTARISDDRNATTAVCRTREGRPVTASFWLADPPAVSQFSIHCPGLDATDLCSNAPPYVICAEGAFVLFCVTLNSSVHHFVYSARGIPAGKPSLHLLLDPRPRVEAFASQQFGILPCGDEHYTVSFLHHQWESRDQAWHYYAYIFSSETNSWRRSKEALVHLSESDKVLFDRHASSKQITMGASSLGLVDLLRGILLVCNLFDDCPVIKFIPFPASRARITDKDNIVYHSPEYFRDVICSGDLIRFVEIDFDEPECRTKGKGWRATTWDRKVCWDDWQKRCTVDVNDVSADHSYSALLPQLLDEETQQLELKKLLFLNPALSVRDDNLLYIMAKEDDADDTALVITVDMERAVLDALIPVSTKPSYTITVYSPCALPKYYVNNKDNAGADMDNPVDKDYSSQENSQKMRKKRNSRRKKHAHVPDRRAKSYLLCFIGCMLIAIIVRVLWPGSSLLI